MKWFFVFAAVALSSRIHAEQRVAQGQSGVFTDHSSLKELPGHIQPVAGKVSLVADFEHVKNGLVTLYLINSTKKPVAVPKQDSDLYCKREAKAEDGEWRRCDSHQYSSCGNSYNEWELLSGGFLTWQQVLDSKKGKVRPVRFRLFGGLDLESNEGVGEVTDADIDFCRYDTLAMASAPFEDVVAVATGEVKGSQVSFFGENNGIRALARFAAE